MERLGRQIYLTFRRTHDLLDERMQRAGGSLPQWVVLRVLSNEPNLSHRELAHRMALTGSTLTHHLDRLEGEGLITRVRDTADRRVVRVMLTAEGKQRCGELDAVADASDAELRGLLAEDEALTLNRLLAKLHTRLAKTQGDTHAP